MAYNEGLKRAAELWGFYRSEVGIEGEEYLELKKTMDVKEIKIFLDSLKEEREKRRETFNTKYGIGKIIPEII